MIGSHRRLDQVDRLIARGSYPRAIELLEQRLAEGREGARQIQLLATLYARTGSNHKAATLLLPLVDRFAEAGFVAKSVAVLKMIERLEPGQQEIEERLAELIRRRQTEIDAELASRQAPRGSRPTPDTVRASKFEARRVREMEAGEEEAKYAEETAPIVDSPLFPGFSSRELVALIRGLGLSTFEAGEILVSEGEPGNCLFVLASGSVRVYARDEEGRNHQIRVLEPPQFFGEVSLFDGTPRTATVVAATPCELLRLDRATLAMIGTKHPDLPRALQRAYTQRSGSPEECEARRISRASEMDPKECRDSRS